MKKAIIIDDDIHLVGFISDLLKEMNIVSETISDARQIELYDFREYDLIFLDLVLPEIDGIEILRHIALNRVSAPIIIMSGQEKRVIQSARSLARAQGLTILGVLEKPFRINELKELVQKSVQPKGMNRGGSSGFHITGNDIRQGILNKEFLFFFQPQIDLQSRKPTGFECLVRWIKADRGMIMPDEFIPVVEEEGLIDELTYHLFPIGLDQLKKWMEAGYDFNLSINFSTLSIKELSLPENLTRYINSYSIDPKKIVIEVTESKLVENLVTALDILTRLRLKGISISIDDFGTGYSSMSQLQQIPFSELKIDKSFVMNALINDDSRVIVQTSIELGHKLGLRVVAEGIETKESLELLRSLNCDLAQGFYFGRPMAMEVADEWLKNFRFPL